MVITLKQKYKSLEPFESQELAPLTIITGKNGSGKSQLMELFFNRYNSGDGDKKYAFFTTNPLISKLQVEGIEVPKTITIAHDNWKQRISGNLLTYNGLSQNGKELLEYILKEGLAEDNQLEKTDLFLRNDRFTSLWNAAIKEVAHHGVHYNGMNPMQRQQQVLKSKGLDNQTFLLTVQEICNHTGKNVFQITDVDFYNTPIPEHLMDRNDLFSSEISMVFYNYMKRWDQNSRNYFYKERFKRENNSIPEDEFIKSNPKPWELLNAILDKHEINFRYYSHNSLTNLQHLEK